MSSPSTAPAYDFPELDSQVQALLERGQEQGQLSMTEIREAFAAAGVSTGQAKGILRSLTDAGVTLSLPAHPDHDSPNPD
ncbi:MAG: RNA polymerase sigma factor region1.1 domain-containing protein, partial [Mycobacteriales bacterium]